MKRTSKKMDGSKEVKTRSRPLKDKIKSSCQYRKETRTSQHNWIMQKDVETNKFYIFCTRCDRVIRLTHGQALRILVENELKQKNG